MIIDAHAHFAVRFGWKHTPEVLIQMMDEGGIDKACITGLADVPGDDPEAYPRLVRALRERPDRLVAGYLRLNPWYGKESRELELVSFRNIARLMNHHADMELERIRVARIPEAAKTKILGDNLLGILAA